ncbi:YncE family protein [Rhodococcus sp. SORGH_AS_0303]|uniref:YncE family protein n=1 Tax=Rhodococcus sp. SORGH_AS_0303 TaxID=3041753 RepID=UPI0027856E1F|nr:YncE family protein [Rhodococcus sp. SORGH_AS_0303]MDQ1200759.1 DNA-binding beta-propeller fold protein YncE [Rhodococcus sp. SORGH_AS_0303]
MTVRTTLFAIATAALTAMGTVAVATPAVAAPGLTDVLFVANNWDGTADYLTPDGNLTRLGRLNVVPDKEQRLAEVYRNPVRAAFYFGIRQLVGEGHDQYADDMYTSKDGRKLIVSRPSFADVVSLDIATGAIDWRFAVDGQRADHMAISDDGTQVAVSASTANTVHILDTANGREIGRFPTGTSPHENVYTKDGRYIINASIGRVETPLDAPALGVTKFPRWIAFYDRTTGAVTRQIDIGRKLAEAGHPDMSSSVRPMTLSPDERFLYLQVSFFHGVVEYDLQQDRVTRVADLPISPAAAALPRESYLLDSAHHGIAMNTAGTKMCVAGTMSDYATVVSRDTLTAGPLVTSGEKPYWSTRSADGQYCFVSWAGSDKVSSISFDTGLEVGSAVVGDHPQRMRTGVVSSSIIG